MKKLLLLLLLPAALHAQNYGSVDYLCQAAAGKTILCYRLPDSTNAIRTVTANAKGFYRFNLPSPGLYLVKYVNTGTDTVSIARFSYEPVVGIGGDSTSNAGRLIQNAEDSLPSTGGILKLPPGVHLIDSLTMTMNTDNLTIEGTGPNCVLKSANSLNAYQLTVANGVKSFTIRNLVMNGNKANQTAGGGININGSTIRRVRIENVIFRHFYDNAVVLANGASDCDIVNCDFDSIGTAGQTSETAAIPVYIVTSCTDIRIKNNDFNWWSGVAAVRINNNCRRIFLEGNKYLSNDRTESADRRAVFAGAATNDSCRDIHLKDEYAFNIDENGFYFNFADSSSFDHCIADSCGNNGFELNANSLTINACQGRRNTAAGVITNNAKGGTISNGIYELNGTRGIYVYASDNDSTTDMGIVGNTCRANSQATDTTYAGIEVGAAGGGTPGKCRRITVVGNPCGDAVAAPRQRFGIQTTNDVDYRVIVGNIVTPKGSGASSGLNDGGTGVNKYVPAGGNP